MKLKKLNLTAVEFFERVINGEVLYLDKDRLLTARFDKGGFLHKHDNVNSYILESLNKPRTVWVEQQWYEDIPKQGVLCWMNAPRLGVILITDWNKLPCDPIIYAFSYELLPSSVTPLTSDEIKSFLSSDEPKHWTERVSTETPVLCYVSDVKPVPDPHSRKVHIKQVDWNVDTPYICYSGSSWKYAIPVDE